MPELEYVDFKVRKEDWTLFELEDKTILKAKFVLVNVLKPKDKIGSYSFNSQTVVGVKVPKELWGEPASTEHPKREVVANIEKEDLNYKCITPDNWSVYELDDGTILSVRLELITVARSTLYNEKGERIYVYSTQPILKPKITKAMLKELP